MSLPGSEVVVKHTNNNNLEASNDDSDIPSPLRLCCIQWSSNTTLGLHLSRAPWDPYPWISDVYPGSTAYEAGIRSGDCVLEVNGEDILGKRIIEVAEKIKQNSKTGSENGVTLLLWNSGNEHNVSPHLLKKFSTILQNMSQLLECPICFDTVKPPVHQCCNGHILCQLCRARSSKCPICRVQLGRRGRCLLADQLYDHLMEEKQSDANTPAPDKKQLTNNSGEQIIPLTSRSQPLRPTNYCSIFKEIFMKKRKELIFNENLDHHDATSYIAKKLFENVVNDRNNELDGNRNTDVDGEIEVQAINCPTGKSCKLMHTRDELFIHLLRSHQLPVTHYYCYPRDVVKIKFTDRAISCLTINQSAGGDKSTNSNYLPKSSSQSCQFFIIKYLKYPNEKICWIWYLGRMLDELKYRIKLKNRESNINFILNPIPISLDVHDVLKLKEYIFIKDNCKHLNIQILIDK